MTKRARNIPIPGYGPSPVRVYDAKGKLLRVISSLDLLNRSEPRGQHSPPVAPRSGEFPLVPMSRRSKEAQPKLKRAHHGPTRSEAEF